MFLQSSRIAASCCGLWTTHGFLHELPPGGGVGVQLLVQEAPDPLLQLHQRLPLLLEQQEDCSILEQSSYKYITLIA